jgi:hypothetical protein
MHFVKKSLQRLLQRLVFSALVELADEVAANFEVIEAEF